MRVKKTQPHHVHRLTRVLPRDVIFRMSLPDAALPDHTLTPGDVVLLSKTKPGAPLGI